MTETQSGENSSSNIQKPLLCMADVRKSFDRVEVLHGINFDVQAGEIHALVGENGAGKSTLMKILAGVYTDYDGRIEIEGQPVRFASPRDAESKGVAIIHQELSLVPYLSVAENMFLGREPLTRLRTVDHWKMRTDAKRFLASLAPDVDVRRPVAEYSVSVQQLIEIGKALSQNARVVVLDEPTSALSDTEAARLFDILRGLRDQGVGMVYISHKLDEIYELADRTTVLRDGEWIGSRKTSDLSRDEMISWMVGREVTSLFPKHLTEPGKELLRLESLTLRDLQTNKPIVDHVDLTVRSGEIVGLGGLMGSGASELMGSIFGQYGRRPTGQVFLDGQPFAFGSPTRAIEAGIGLVTNDRKSSGLVLSMSVMHNMTLASLPQATRAGWLKDGIERQLSRPLAEDFSLKAPSLDSPITALSGGNQQKVVLAKWLMTQPRLLLLDEPTRGIDVGAKAEIYELMNRWTEAGIGILLITSELPELLAMSDRIIVMAQGKRTAEFSRDEATQERIMAAAVTVGQEAPAGV